MIKRPGGPLAASRNPSRSEILPLLRTWPALASKAFLVPSVLVFAAAEILFTALHQISLGNEVQFWTDVYFWTVAISAAAGTLFFIYRLCGKKRSFLLLIAVAVLEGALALECTDLLTFLNLHTLPEFMAPGVVEEAFKAIPIAAMLLVTPLLSPARRESLGLTEPLDGILFAAASALGFGVAETMFVYVPERLNDAGVAAYLLSIPRTLDLLAGHVAFTSCLGYAIGLALIRSSRALGIVIVGYMIAASLHNLWDDTPSIVELQTAVAVLSYAFLASAILKARQISPNRYRLRPSVILDPVAAPPPQSAPAAWPPRGGAPLPIWLAIGSGTVELYAGAKLREGSIPSLQSGAGDRIVAEVSPNPSDPSIQGLKNLSQTTWSSLSLDGSRHQVLPGRTIRLANGTRLDFGLSEGLILVGSAAL